MARQLEHFPNLVTMFLTRAREKGDAPFLWAKRGGEWKSVSWNEAPAAGRGLRRKPEGNRARARRPGHAGQREPSRMADRRPWDHGRRLHHRPGLHDQHDARSHAHPRQFGREGGDRLEPEAGEEPHPGRPLQLRMQSRHRHRGHSYRAGAGDGRLPSLGRAGGRGRRPRGSREAHAAGRSRRTSPASSTPAAPAERRAASCSITERSSPISPVRPTSSRPTSAGTTRSSCPSFRQATPTSIPAVSTSRSGSARRSIMPRASRSWRRTSRRSGRRSWSSYRGCSRCSARAS